MFENEQVLLKSFLIDLMDFYHKKLAFVPVLILNLTHFSLKLYQLDRDELVIFERDQTMDYADLLEYCLLLLSFANAIYLFTYCKKPYSLMHHPTQEEYPSSEYSSGWDLELKSKNARLELLKSDRLVWVLNLWDPHPGKILMIDMAVVNSVPVV